MLHHPAATTSRLNRVRALRLRRRDADDLALMRIEQLERDDAVVDFASRLLAGLVRSGNAAAVRDVLPETLPWTAFLPDDDVGVFLAELSSVARGAADLDNLGPVSPRRGDRAARRPSQGVRPAVRFYDAARGWEGLAVQAAIHVGGRHLRVH